MSAASSAADFSILILFVAASSPDYHCVNTVALISRSGAANARCKKSQWYFTRETIRSALMSHFELRAELSLRSFNSLCRKFSSWKREEEGWWIDFSHNSSQRVMAEERRVYRLMLLWNLLCAFPSVGFGASLCFTTDLKISFCLSFSVCLSFSGALTSSLCKITHTTQFIAVKSRVLQQKSHRRLFLLHECRRPHIVSFVPLPEVFVLLSQRDHVCAGTGWSWFSTVLGNHFSLYWFRCLSLLVFVMPL